VRSRAAKKGDKTEEDVFILSLIFVLGFDQWDDAKAAHHQQQLANCPYWLLRRQGNPIQISVARPVRPGLQLPARIAKEASVQRWACTHACVFRPMLLRHASIVGHILSKWPFHFFPSSPARLRNAWKQKQCRFGPRCRLRIHVRSHAVLVTCDR
jgi:hypothetical protein